MTNDRVVSSPSPAPPNDSRKHCSSYRRLQVLFALVLSRYEQLTPQRSRGLGNALVKELLSLGLEVYTTVRGTSATPHIPPEAHVITGVDSPRKGEEQR